MNASSESRADASLFFQAWESRCGARVVDGQIDSAIAPFAVADLVSNF